jgi:hypothetical protein
MKYVRLTVKSEDQAKVAIAAYRLGLASGSLRETIPSVDLLFEYGDVEEGE